jgi:hypothetical protein
LSDKKLFPLIISAFTFLTIVYTSKASGPVITLLAVIFALGMWSYRQHVSLLRYAVLGTLITLHIVMKDPVWALIYRVSIVSGSTGYFRYALINRAIEHFREWAFAGTNNMAYWGWGLQDVTNQYIRIGVDAGVLTLIFFVLMVWFAFRKVGQVVYRENNSLEHKYMAWVLGVALFGHAVSFLAVSYFGQILLYFYMVLGAISSFPLSQEPIPSAELHKGENFAEQSLPGEVVALT